MESLEDKLKRTFVGCRFHGDDYEGCILYTGTAPCEEQKSGRETQELLNAGRELLKEAEEYKHIKN